MSQVKQTFLLFRLALACIAMLVAYILSTMVIGETNVIMTPEEASQAGMALVVVSLIDALVLSFLILRSPWRGLKLIGVVILVHFGVETFMAQTSSPSSCCAAHCGLYLAQQSCG